MNRMRTKIMKRSLFICLLATAFLSACSTPRVVDERKAVAHGMTFTAEYRHNEPYNGFVPYEGASDYFWVTEYQRGKAIVRRHYFIQNGKLKSIAEDDLREDKKF
jgi:hypothetical protein